MKEWLKNAISGVYRWIMTWTEFFHDQNNKLSSKRLLALGFGLAGIWLLLIDNLAAGLIATSACVAISIIGAITKS